MKRPDPERGFTLPELLVAITILGIIMTAISAMIITAFRTTETVSTQLNASRGPKVVSRYWVPDVESAVGVAVGAGGACGSGPGTAVATFGWTEEPSTIDEADADPPAGPPVTVTYWRRDGTRNQLVRVECSGGAAVTDTTTVVADLDDVAFESEGRVRTLRVTVPDTSRATKQFEFSVAARQQVTP